MLSIVSASIFEKFSPKSNVQYLRLSLLLFLFFSPMCPSAGVIFPALLLWRFFTFYITLIIGGITNFFSTAIVHKGEKEQDIPSKSTQE